MTIKKIQQFLFFILSIILCLVFYGAVITLFGCSDDNPQITAPEPQQTQEPEVIAEPEPEDPSIEIPIEPEPESESETEITEETEPDPEPEQPEIITGEPIIAIKTEDKLKLYDGTYLWTWKQGNIIRAKSKNYSCNEILYKLDNYGDTEESRELITIPDKITVTKNTTVKSILKEITLKDSNVWIIEDISADEAMQAGALPKPYTKIYRNAEEYGDWMDNQYELEKIITLGNDIYGQIPTTAWYNLNGSKENVRVVTESGLAIYNYDTYHKRCTINGIDVSYTLNFFNGAKQWQKSGDTWYSQNGYSWNGSTLIESGLAMENYRTVGNMVIPAGTRYENSEDIIYWVLCSTGEVIRQVPSLNKEAVYINLYIADGTTATGLQFINTLKPQIIDDYLYFIFDNDVFRHNFTTGITSPFIGNVEEIWEY